MRMYNAYSLILIILISRRKCVIRSLVHVPTRKPRSPVPTLLGQPKVSRKIEWSRIAPLRRPVGSSLWWSPQWYARRISVEHRVHCHWNSRVVSERGGGWGKGAHRAQFPSIGVRRIGGNAPQALVIPRLKASFNIYDLFRFNSTCKREAYLYSATVWLSRSLRDVLIPRDLEY